VITYPLGFEAAGIAAGLKPSGREDLALLVAPPGATAAGLFTTNRVQAAPVRLARERLGRTGGVARAVLVNSGQANAGTGERGLADAVATTDALAALLGCAPDEVLPCSTGVIGEPLPVEAIRRALPALVAARSPEGSAAFARAILTTDTVDKQAAAEADGYRVGGAAKGVGMVAPHLATMLAFVTTDAPVSAADLSVLADEALRPAFEAITVDGCTSTNDSVLLLASGAADGEPVVPGTPAWVALAGACRRVADELARRLIADAEGAEHVLIVDVEGAASERDAGRLARAVADSPLVKTAAFGRDPNPGRILQALGAAGVELDPTSIDVWIADVRVVEAGVIPPAYFGDDGLRASASAAMAGSEIPVRVRVGGGPGAARVLGCDLTYGYVRINGEYTT
jgi:glutamate N-acetyltransferase/amino-acid N-acetyltransferase